MIKQSRRNPVSRLFRAKGDKDMIAAWRLDLNRILHVFNVRSIICSPPLLTVLLQTELAINTHTAVYNTQNIVSEIHRTIVNSREGTDGSSRLVSDLFALFAAR